MQVIYFFIKYEDIQNEILSYFKFINEEDILSYCVKKLFCDIYHIDEAYKKNQYLINKNLYYYIKEYHNVLNLYILYAVEYLCYFINRLLANNDNNIEITIQHIDNIICILYIFITKDNQVDSIDSLYNNLNTLSYKYVNTDYGLKKRNEANKHRLFVIPLHVTRINRQLYQLNYKKIYLHLMSFAFIRNNINTLSSNDSRIRGCYYRIMALKLILRSYMVSQGLYVCKDFDNFTQDVINGIKNTTFDNVSMNRIAIISLYYFQISIQNDITLNDYLIYHKCLYNGSSIIDENITNENMISTLLDEPFIDLNVTGGELFSQSLKMVKDLIANHNGKLPTKNILQIYDGSVAIGDGVMVSWIQKLSLKCIDDSGRYLFIKSHKDTYIPYILSNKAFLQNENAYKFVGHVIGLSIKMKILFTIEFEDYVYDILLGNLVNLDLFIRSEYPFYFNKNFQGFRYDDIVNQLKFCIIDYANEEFEQTDIIIISEEKMFKLKESNKTNINEIIKQIFINQIEICLMRAILKIREGILQIVDDSRLVMYENYEDFKNSIFGDYFIDLAKWQVLTNVKVTNDEDELTAELFWKYIEMLTMDKRKTILKFWTGTTNLPKDQKDAIFVLEIKNNFEFDVQSSTCCKTLYLKTITDIKEFDLIFGTGGNEFEIDANHYNEE